MERSEVTEVRFASCEDKIEEIGVESLQFGEEIQVLMSVPPESGSSFTALLELPANQAVELLHATPADEVPAEISDEVWSDSGLIDPPKPYHHHPRPFVCTPTFPSNTALLDRASRFSVFASATENSPETSSIPSNSSANAHKVKPEPVDSDSNPTNSSPVVSDAMVPNQSPKSTKRKEREKKVKATTKKSKMEDDGEKLPYVHVRARRGQATDSHSLAERARREKINARMKLLQDLVPGCSKISGTAMVLDEIISHVQSLQRQVEILSMSLAAVNPSTDVNLESLLAAESGSLTDISFPGVVMPLIWPELEGQVNGSRQQHYQQLWNFDGLHHPGWGREDDNPHFIAPENSLLSYDSSANSASLQTNRLKMEL